MASSAHILPSLRACHLEIIIYIPVIFIEGNADDGYSNVDENKVISVLGAEGNVPYFADFQISSE